MGVGQTHSVAYRHFLALQKHKIVFKAISNDFEDATAFLPAHFWGQPVFQTWVTLRLLCMKACHNPAVPML